MVLGVGHLQLHALKLHASTQRQGGTVGTLAVAVADLHLRGTQGVVARRHVELLTQQQVGTQHQVLAQPVLPVVQANQRDREAQGRAHQPLRDTQLQV